jgi:opacity protein-like surface antigen
MKSKIGLFAMCGFGALLPLAAQADDLLHPYVGISYVYAKAQDLKIGGRDIALPDEVSQFNDNVTTGKGYVGLDITRWLGLEAQYIYLGETEDHGFKVKGDAYTGAAVLSLPLADDFVSLFVKGGLVWWDVKLNGPDPLDFKKNGDRPFYGAGIKVKILPHLLLRAEYERVPVDKDNFKVNFDLASAGLQFTF